MFDLKISPFRQEDLKGSDAMSSSKSKIVIEATTNATSHSLDRYCIRATIHSNFSNAKETGHSP